MLKKLGKLIYNTKQWNIIIKMKKKIINLIFNGLAILRGINYCAKKIATSCQHNTIFFVNRLWVFIKLIDIENIFLKVNNVNMWRIGESPENNVKYDKLSRIDKLILWEDVWRFTIYNIICPLNLYHRILPKIKH